MRRLIVLTMSVYLGATMLGLAQGKNSIISLAADTLVFADGEGDGVSSDALGAVLQPDSPTTYRNGVGGVQITINNIQSGGTGDLTMSLFGTKNPVRYIRFLLFNPTNVITGISVPRDEIHDKSFLNVKNVWDVKSGAASRMAIFTLAEGELRFPSVAVERVDGTTWRVSTDSGVGGSPVARYFAKVKSRLTYAADYVLPFQFEVTCEACGNPPVGSR